MDTVQFNHKIALQFSGGRDSLALLLYMRPHWDNLTVYYCNTGDAYPETIALMKAVKEIVPHFIEVQGNVHTVIEQYGLPSDVLHAQAQHSQAYSSSTKLNDRHNCCFLTMMKPLHDRMKQDGITVILRGQRNQDDPKSIVQSGQVIDGFKIIFPIAEWTIADVEEFITESGCPIPPYYAEGMTSAPDCMHCTAWLEHGSYKYLTKYHPTVAKEVNRRLLQIKVVVQNSIDKLDETLKT
jgi:3'-phosphoadenosine 5'-phosphosulfate sulfotransferase (PAPS reductase)/FAD synthetase